MPSPNEMRVRTSKDERNRRIAGTDARPAVSFTLRMFSGRHPRDVPDHRTACHSTIVHLASTPAPSRILDARCHMQRGAELRRLEEEATLECRVQRQTRRCVSRGSIKDQARVRWA